MHYGRLEEEEWGTVQEKVKRGAMGGFDGTIFTNAIP